MKMLKVKQGQIQDGTFEANAPPFSLYVYKSLRI